jgi:uncharacterized UPF0160 family protein
MNRIGTHSGSFHADDALGVAMLLALYPNAEVVRTRDPEVWATCDALVDVGGEHDHFRNRFDHHQKGFSERRENGIPFAGAGLVWRAWGECYVQDICTWLGTAEAKAIAADVDARLIQHADAVDSGVNVPGPQDFSLSGIISTMNSTWQDAATPAEDDDRFAEAVALAGAVLKNLVRTVAAEHRAVVKVMTGQPLADGRILVLDTPRLPFDAVIVGKLPNVLFVVYPESSDKQYQVRVVPKVLGTYAARADLPAAWAGLRGAELAKVTGVADAVFAHNGRFICGAQSKAGAIRLAELAVAAL